MKEPRVIGCTTNEKDIPRLLGVEKGTIGLYQETKMGKYYGPMLNGVVDESRIIRLMNAEQAKDLEMDAVKMIACSEKRMRHLLEVPKVNITTPIKVDLSGIQKATQQVNRAVKSCPKINQKKISKNLDRVSEQVRRQFRQHHC